METAHKEDFYKKFYHNIKEAWFLCGRHQKKDPKFNTKHKLYMYNLISWEVTTLDTDFVQGADITVHKPHLLTGCACT